jgi:hypothetical protein
MGFTEKTKFEIITLIGTALSIIWYTIETHQLRKVSMEQLKISNEQLMTSNEQLRLSIKPVLSIAVTSDFEFTLRNIGNGAAMNIKFDTIDLYKPLEKMIKIPRLYSLRSSEFINIPILSKDKSAGSIYKNEYIKHQLTTSNIEFFVNFEDINGTKYSQTIILGENPTIEPPILKDKPNNKNGGS